MYKIYSLVFALLFSLGLYGQNEDRLNMEMVSNLTYPTNLSDIWGYVAPDGHEYAILGTNVTTSVVDLIDPRNPVEVASIPGTSSIWRDMKSFGEFVYVTNDVADGLLIIDMRGAPNNITSEFWTPSLEINGETNTVGAVHNIYIDDEGYAYLAGSRSLNNGAVIILDVFSTPGQPQYVGAVPSINNADYSHDAMVQNNLLYSSDINGGFFSVIDVSDKTDPMVLSTQSSSFNYTHNAWVSDDNNYLFTTDEKPNANLDSYDISDLTDIKRLDTFQPEVTKGEGTIPHNTHYHEGYLVTSWYTDGVRIIDAHKPDNLVEVAYYDTYPQNGSGFFGVWGVTPYLPSGIVIASDINTGLYVFDVDYKRAAYLEGVITDFRTELPIEDVSVVITSSQLNSKTSNNLGEYKTGLAEPGTYDITFSKFGYVDKTLSAVIVAGETTILDVELVPEATYTISGTIRSKTNNAPIEGGRVFVQSENDEFEVVADADGIFVIENLLEADYLIYSGAWGYENILVNNALSISQDENIEILLGEAYMDDFIVDQGWTVLDEAQTGAWERENPIGTPNGNSFANPNVDVDGDIGNKAYITGNEVGEAGEFDIDGGSVTLTSPIMDLTSYSNPLISYRLWFFNGGGNGNPNDTLVVKISNGTEEVEVEVLTVLESDGSWRPTSSFNPSDLLDITASMQFSVTASDNSPGHLVEAGLDQFLVAETVVGTKDLIVNDVLTAQPNPFDGMITLKLDDNFSGKLKVTNVLGELVEIISFENTDQMQIGNQYAKGAYFITLESNNQTFKALRIIKQ